MGPKTEMLVEILTELEQTLIQYEEDRWAKRISESSRRLRNSDISGLTHLLGAYGGMGSFNDVLFHPSNGHDLTEAEAERVNGRFSDLRAKAWTLAREIKREAIVG